MNYDFARRLGINSWLIALTVLQYCVAFYFIFQFYRRYREISVLDNAQKLMKRIFRTRQTVKHYVIFCLAMILMYFLLFIIGMAMDDNLVATLELNTQNQTLDPGQLKWITIGIMAAAGIIFTTLMGGIYFLLYGLLTRKLFRNYQELKHIKT